MRVVAGFLGGRILHEPHGNRTHPMSEKIRGALFNTLGDINGLSVLDAFAGTGALGIEAVSRGASTVQAVDSDKEAARCVSKNISSLKLGHLIKFTEANVSSWLQTNDKKQFDIVLADPPYDEIRWPLLKKVVNAARIQGVVVLSLPSGQQPMLSEDFHLLSQKYYGDAKLVFYRRIR